MITIAIVKYKGLSEHYFEKSLYSALSQIGVYYMIDIYHEGKIKGYDYLDKVHLKEIPEGICEKGSKIREYIVDNTETPYVAFWDSDDVYTVNRLHEQYKKIKKGSLDICFSNFGFFNNKKIYGKDFFSMIGYGDRIISILDENYLGLGTVTAEVSYLRTLKPFPDLKTLDWWIAIKSVFKDALMDSCGICGYYRLYEESLSNSFLNPQKKDFFNEINQKLSLYGLLSDRKRYDFYSEIQLDKDYEDLKRKFEERKYKNMWGGLIQYE